MLLVFENSLVKLSVGEDWERVHLTVDANRLLLVKVKFIDVFCLTERFLCLGCCFAKQVISSSHLKSSLRFGAVLSGCFACLFLCSVVFWSSD